LLSSGGFTVEVARDCCGYEGVGLIWVFLAGNFWWFRSRLRFPRVWLLFPLATLAVWGANVVRIAALVLVGSHLSPALAVGGFHSYLGIVLFSGVALATAGIAHRSPWFSRDIVKLQGGTNPAAPFLVPFLGMLVVALITGLWSRAGFDPLYGVRVIVIGAVLWRYREHYRTIRWNRSPIPLLVGFAIFILWIALDHGTANASGLEILAQPGRWPWILSRLAGSILIAPIVEELAFRGYLARRLSGADFRAVSFNDLSWRAILISSACFGAMHEQWAAGFAAGIAYAWVARRSGRLSHAILAHSATNALLSLYVLNTHAWSLWN
jgi:exosortase E/protease (VPEID-CTERM system)